MSAATTMLIVKHKHRVCVLYILQRLYKYCEIICNGKCLYSHNEEIKDTNKLCELLSLA